MINVIFVIIGIALLNIIFILWDMNKDLKKQLKHAQHFNPDDLWLIKEKLKLMQPREFEEFCNNLWRMHGYHSILTSATNDFGRDIILKKDKETIFVECKHWRYDDEGFGSKVSRPIGMKLKGSMDYGIDGKTRVEKGIIMTTSEYTDECLEYCQVMGIECYNMNDIMEMVKNIGTINVYDKLGIKPSYI
jgi:restriction system protein